MRALLILGAGLLLAPAQQAKDPLEGTWEQVSAAEDGNKPKAVSRTDLILGDGKFIIHLTMRAGLADNVGTYIEYKYAADPTQKPPTMDITPLSGAQKGKTIRAIYTIEKDELKICQTTLAEMERPTEFVSKRGTLLLIFKKRPN
jgi:uncharacterized protein (TIGR03067 family)